MQENGEHELATPGPSVLTRKLALSINRHLINKNESGDPRLYVRGFTNVEVTPSELAKAINFGMAFCCQLAGEDRNQGNFLGADVLAVDIDGGLRIDEIDNLEVVRKHLTILYTTPSHTEDQHRFRMVFALERPIETAAEMRAALRSLTLKVAGDLAATDPARISFGSRNSNPTTFDRQLDATTIDQLIAQGLDADVSDSVHQRKTSTTISRWKITGDEPVALEDGTRVAFISIPSGTKVHCPFHYDRNPSAFITRTQRGETCLHCSTCNQSFFQPGSQPNDYEFNEFDDFLKRASKYFQEHRDYGPFFPDAATHPGLTGTTLHTHNLQFFGLDKLERGLTLIKSPKGTGKTELMRHLTSDDSTLLIGHRRSLIRQSCERLDLECYLDCDPGPIRQRRLGICLDSLGRLIGTGDTMNHSTVIIDESEQVLSHFLADTLTKGESAKPHSLFSLFRRILQTAKRVIALDADLGWLTFETLRRIVTSDSKTPAPIHLHANYYETSRTIELFESDKHLVSDILESLELERRVFVASNSKRRIHRIESIMKERVPMLECIAISSETSGQEDVQAFLKNASAEALKYQLILASPTLGTGVDITFPASAQEIDVVLAFVNRGSQPTSILTNSWGEYVIPRRSRFGSRLEFSTSIRPAMSLERTCISRDCSRACSRAMTRICNQYSPKTRLSWTWPR